MKKLFLISMAFLFLGVFTVNAETFTKPTDENVITLSVENDLTLTKEVLIVENNVYFVVDHLKMLTLETTFIVVTEKGVIYEDHLKKLYGIETSQSNLFVYTGINAIPSNPNINKFNSVSICNKNIKRGLSDKQLVLKTLFSLY